MATTSFTLGEHWEVFMKNQIASGKYVSAQQGKILVVRV
jgi:antitoxin ParD1/3/4